MAAATTKKSTSNVKTTAPKAAAKETKAASAAKVEETKVPVNESKAEGNAEIEQLKQLLKAQAEQIEQLKAESQRNATISYAAVPVDERVMFLWQAPVADYNEVTFGVNGRYGRIVGKSGSFFVPKSELSQVLDAQTRAYLDNRWLIILSGLDEQEREMFGVNYKPGEYLSKEAFMKVTEIGDEIINIYPNLCPAHKEIVAKFYYEAFKENRPIKRDVVVKLNKISGNEAFKAILDEMNLRDLDE